MLESNLINNRQSIDIDIDFYGLDLKENIQLKKESKADINSKNISNKSVQAPEELKPVKQDKYICIVLACRVTKKNADAFVTKLTTKGYEAST